MQHDSNHPELFACGMSMLQQGCLTEATEVFRQLVEDECSHEPRHVSHYGFLTAAVEGNTESGRELCARAVDLAHYDRQVHLNLLRVHENLDAMDTAANVLLDAIRRAKGGTEGEPYRATLEPVRQDPVSLPFPAAICAPVSPAAAVVHEPPPAELKLTV